MLLARCDEVRGSPRSFAHGDRYSRQRPRLRPVRDPAILRPVARTYRALDNPTTGSSLVCDFGPYAGDVVKWVV